MVRSSRKADLYFGLGFYKAGAGSRVIELAMVGFIFCEGENIRAGSRKKIESRPWSALSSVNVKILEPALERE